VSCNRFIILYIYLVYLDYFYICGDCAPVRVLEVNKNSIQKFNPNSIQLLFQIINVLRNVCVVINTLDRK
jgi:hypothetical protein